MLHKKNYLNILLIEDDEDDCYLFREAMAEVAPDILLSFLENADNLLEEVTANPPSLVIIDYKLPGENGIEGVRNLKAHAALKDIPVVMWSTSSLVDNVTDAYNAGVQYYFEKPWDLKVLAEKLRIILQRNKMIEEPAGPRAGRENLGYLAVSSFDAGFQGIPAMTGFPLQTRLYSF